MELRDVVAVVWKRRLVAATTLVATVLGSLALAVSIPKEYESTATLALTPDVSQGQGFVAADNLSALLRTYAQAAESQVTLARAAKHIGQPLPGSVETSTETGTGIMRITGRSESPQGAELTARAVARAFEKSIADNRLVVSALIDPAKVPTEPVQPRPPLIISVGLVLGLMAAVMLALGSEHFRRRIETPSDVSELTEVPVIGRLPRERALQRSEPRTIWSNGRLNGLHESYRALRTNLEFVIQGQGQGIEKAPAIQVTSPELGQGKSTVVANLGISLAQLGIHTVIIDADLRRPRQHQIFELRNEGGLSSALERGSGELSPKRTKIDNLFVLPSGPVSAATTELLHINFRQVLSAAHSSGAVILIDSPPILPVADSRLIAPLVDGVLLVVAAGREKPANLRSALDRLSLTGASVIGIVLNESRSDSEGEYHYDELTAASSRA